MIFNEHVILSEIITYVHLVFKFGRKKAQVCLSVSEKGGEPLVEGSNWFAESLRHDIQRRSAGLVLGIYNHFETFLRLPGIARRQCS